MDIKFIKFDVKGDERGSLIALEEYKNIPFQIKRVYFIFDTKSDVSRGYHAHKNLKQVLIPVKGSCKILLENYEETEEVLLSDQRCGLYIDALIWRVMYEFSDDCVLLVLASDYYNENDYIRNYDQFRYEIKQLITSGDNPT